jgi:DNA-binding TFAR19-related protein (PDSD5 family)
MQTTQLQRIPVREYIPQAEREHARKAQEAMNAMRKDWLYQMVSSEAQRRLIREVLRGVSI